MYKFFVTENEICGNEINIIGDDVNHIKNVLRLGVNEKIEVCNINNSISYECKICEISRTNVKCEVIKHLSKSREPKVYLHIFQGLPKGDKMETIIQKTTELGVSEITPLIMNRCVVKLDDKSKTKKLERFRKIAEVASKQCKRDRIPIINLPIDIKNIYEKIEDYDIVLVAYENERNNNIKKFLEEIPKNKNFKIAVIIGPEGGIEESEILKLQNSNKVKVISLGNRILRTETAPIALTCVIMYEFNEM